MWSLDEFITYIGPFAVLLCLGQFFLRKYPISQKILLIILAYAFVFRFVQFFYSISVFDGAGQTLITWGRSQVSTAAYPSEHLLDEYFLNDNPYLEALLFGMFVPLVFCGSIILWLKWWERLEKPVWWYSFGGNLLKSAFIGGFLFITILQPTLPQAIAGALVGISVTFIAKMINGRKDEPHK